MRNTEKNLDKALTGFERTGDVEIDGLVDVADDLTRQLAVGVPSQPRERALFIEGVGARKRSFLSSLIAPAIAVAALMLVIAVIGRTALPGDSLYPVRKVLRSAGLATSPATDLERELEKAQLDIDKAQAAVDRGSDPVPSAVAALMHLGRAEGYLNEVDASDRVGFEGDIAFLEEQAVVLIKIGPADDKGGQRSGSGDDSSGSGSDDSGGDTSGSDDSGGDSSGSGSDDSGGDTSGSDDSSGDNSGSGSDDSGSDTSGSDDSTDDNSGSGSADSGGDTSGSGSGDSTDDNSGSGSGD
jgi:hypothetical protein